MNSDIKRAVEIIDQRIANLQNIRSRLIEEFGGDSPAVVVVARPVQSHNGNGNQTRVQQLTRFLLEHGPAKRKQIIDGAGMPKGTIASLLNRPEFVRRSDGKWQVDIPSSAAQETTQ